jgi:hypothetical protein
MVDLNIRELTLASNHLVNLDTLHNISYCVGKKTGKDMN